MQALQAVVTVQVPEDKVLVDKVEYMELKEKEYIGKTWKIKEMKEELGITKSVTWITECILKPNYKDIKDWCFIKEGKGGRGGTIVLASKAKRWFDENWSRIDWEERI